MGLHAFRSPPLLERLHCQAANGYRPSFSRRRAECEKLITRVQGVELC